MVKHIHCEDAFYIPNAKSNERICALRMPGFPWAISMKSGCRSTAQVHKRRRNVQKK
jgi:hypothetical protein